MDYIKHTYTLQWVGPMTYEEYKEYCIDSETLSPQNFNLYYFEARKDGRYNWDNYFGIHKQNDGIQKRVNTSHEHLGVFIKEEAKHMKIWIGSFANPQDQKPKNIDIVETLFIKAYASQLTLNTKKKKKMPDESVCIVNTFYKRNDTICHRKTEKPSIFDDVLVYLEETNCFKHGNLSKFTSNNSSQ